MEGQPTRLKKHQNSPSSVRIDICNATLTRHFWRCISASHKNANSLRNILYYNSPKVAVTQLSLWNGKALRSEGGPVLVIPNVVVLEVVSMSGIIRCGMLQVGSLLIYRSFSKGTFTQPLSMWKLEPFRMWACKSGMGKALIAASSVSKGTYSYSSESISGSVVAAERILVPTIIPQAPPPSQADLERLYAFVNDSKRLVVLTGAGASTECGIPDYRSPHGAYSSGFKPMSHQEFVGSEQSRRRYWARSYAGWRRFISTKPGPTYISLKQLESKGRVKGMITQNVDRLHFQAGSNPIELHGTTHEVICLECGDLTDRHLFQNRVKRMNPEWAQAVESVETGHPGSDSSFGMKMRPDGDLEIDEKFFRKENFHIPACKKCSGVLKPDVVFFGDNVPRRRVELCTALARSADALLVVGSTVMTMSALRLVRAAVDMGSPIALLNIGPTRADDLATLKINGRSGEVLPRLLHMGSMSVPPS